MLPSHPLYEKISLYAQVYDSFGAYNISEILNIEIKSALHDEISTSLKFPT